MNSALPKNTKEVIDYVKKFKKYELRKDLYEIVRKEGDVKKAIKILLVGWNWRAYMGSNISNNSLNNQIKGFLNNNEKLLDYLKKREATLKNIQFDDKLDNGRTIREWIIEGFNELCGKDAIGSTGASKVYHMFYPQVFMMWDRRIIRKYHDKTNKRHWRKHERGKGKCYQVFLEETQKFIKSIKRSDWKRIKKKIKAESYKTQTKIMDEYNYGKFTLN